MNLDIKYKILILLTAIGFGLLLTIMILGVMFPGNLAPGQAPWFVWAAIVETGVFLLAAVVIGIVVRKKDKENYA